MARVICTLPNASMHISGIDFEPHDLGVISKDDVPIEVAERFARIPGYKLELKAAKKAAGEAEEQKSAKLAKEQKRLADEGVEMKALEANQDENLDATGTEHEVASKVKATAKKAADKAVDPVAPKEEDKTADGEAESKGE